ncbi:MAG: 3-phosphoshikimate 1-carboxyvinyltransferase, partial [Clostridia bacterium]|nr:3-phosphoshikimate 1-carboxyvinyltransferase [Clostridia bacterium]
HRIVMAFSIGAAFAGKQSTVTDAEAINKSYPKFFEDYKSIGGVADVI